MTRALVLDHAGGGPVDAAAEAIAEGVRSAPGVRVGIERVPALVLPSAARTADAPRGRPNGAQASAPTTSCLWKRTGLRTRPGRRSRQGEIATS